MKRFSLCLVAVAMMVLVSSVNGGTRANGKLDEILANMQKMASTIKTIQAHFDQLSRDPNIGGTEKYSGEVFFKHVGTNNDKIKIVYAIPKGQQVCIGGDDITLYQAEINQAILTTRRAAASRGDDFAFIATPYTSIPELKKQYNIEYLGDDQGMAKLDLTPRGKSSIKKFTWWVDQTTWMPMKSTVIESNGKPTTFTLSNVAKNKGVSESTFKCDLPKGTKIIRR